MVAGIIIGISIGIFDPLSQEVGGVDTIPQLRVYGIALTS